MFYEGWKKTDVGRYPIGVVAEVRRVMSYAHEQRESLTKIAREGMELVHCKTNS